MRTMHPILLIGAYDWSAENPPRSGFENRIAAARTLMIHKR